MSEIGCALCPENADTDLHVREYEEDGWNEVGDVSICNSCLEKMKKNR